MSPPRADRLVSLHVPDPAAAACPRCERELEHGIARREFLRLSIGGTLGFLLAGRTEALGALAQAAAAGQARADHLIVLWMTGGPSQLDTFDPKPGTETGGPFQAIDTAVAGIQVSEHLPQVAKEMRDLAVVRSMTSKEGNHQRARYLLHTGYPPQGTVAHPAFGSVVASERGKPEFDLPNFISIGGPAHSAGFLGVAHAPYVIDSPMRPPENLAAHAGVDRARADARHELLAAVDRSFGLRGGQEEARAHGAVYAKAVRMMRSPLAKAFDLTEEKPELRAAYGQNTFGQGCLLARRLVEVGVPVVEVNQNGWDTHRNNFDETKGLMKVLDPGYATLLADLRSRGLLERTLVVWMGEFGRTPRINGNAGRDHFPRAWTAVLGGGGIRGGQVVGATAPDGSEVRDRPVTVPDLFATLCVALGLDPEKENVSPQGRPIAYSDKGKAVAELLG
jgi:uncharacterized protein (DUF1501 family)